MHSTGSDSSPAFDFSVDGLQTMLLGYGMPPGLHMPRLSMHLRQHSTTPNTWIRRLMDAPEGVRTALWVKYSPADKPTIHAWAPSIQDKCRKLGVGAINISPLDAFIVLVTLDPHGGLKPNRIASTHRLTTLLQRMGLFRVQTSEVLRRTFRQLLTDPVAPAALHSLLSDRVVCKRMACDSDICKRMACDNDKVNAKAVREMLIAATKTVSGWGAFLAASVPLALIAVKVEWTPQNVNEPSEPNPLHLAIAAGHDGVAAWLAARLPPHRLNELGDHTSAGGTPLTPLIAALKSKTEMPNTVRALISRVPDVNLQTIIDGSKAVAIASTQSWRWLPLDLTLELELKTEQFGENYGEMAASIMNNTLQSFQVPNDLKKLILDYVALPFFGHARRQVPNDNANRVSGRKRKTPLVTPVVATHPNATTNHDAVSHHG